jgi:hypothetical protein
MQFSHLYGDARGSGDVPLLRQATGALSIELSALRRTRPALRSLFAAFVVASAATTFGTVAAGSERGGGAGIPDGVGEFGAPLRVLKRFHSPPGAPGESNHFIDMWDQRGLRALLRTAGLTNNHALFVNSHGEAIPGTSGARYAFSPHRTLVPPGQPTPRFSARDLARVVGNPALNQIHNIVIAGCNEEGAFRAEELRRHFPAATNVTHVVAGERGHQPMLIQAILARSASVETLFEAVRTTGSGERRYFVGSQPAPGARRLSPYIAELFLPGYSRSFRSQTAGRELLDPVCSAPNWVSIER